MTSAGVAASYGTTATTSEHDARPNEGIGQPEALKHGLHGYWSRRVSHEHRLIYQGVDDEPRVAARRYHCEG